MGRPRAVEFEAQDTPATHDNHASIREEVEAQWNGGLANDDLALALEIEGDNLVGDPVRDPETAVAPTWRLAEHETGHQGSHFGHRVLQRHQNLLGRRPSGCLATLRLQRPHRRTNETVLRRHP